MCKRCKERYKDGARREWAGSKPQCASKRGVFTGDNWNCVTMNERRLIADDRLQTCDRHNDRSFGYMPVRNGRYIAESRLLDSRPICGAPKVTRIRGLRP